MNQGKRQDETTRDQGTEHSQGDTRSRHTVSPRSRRKSIYSAPSFTDERGKVVHLTRR